MSTKPQTFMSAPRPTSRTSPEDAAKLLNATSDLGFGRASTELGSDKATQEKNETPPTLLKTKNLKREASAPEGREDISRPSEVATQSLRIDVSGDVWTALKLATIERRVSMKFLMMEALHAQGYPVDLSSVAEDGRRKR